MSVFRNFVGASIVSMGMCMAICVANAATGRAGYDNVRTTSVGATAAQRMPSMPTLPLNAVGNISTNVPDNGGVPPQKPDEPQPQPEPDPVPECPDGGVKDSTYTVENCMTDVLNCVNNGALPNGLNDLFNEDLRNAIVNGMGLCMAQVEKCVSDVRRDCANVYRSAADVWIDFNSRKIQPEYYNFVLRKTGLTPNQAENTCRLLDKNTFGPSFSAVANDGKTTAEYNQQVGAYNSQQGNVLVKTNPQGVRVNDNNPGVDGQRGHYARWDATTATCLIRVAAYNKDSHISNSWLFGAVGDDRPAEVWQAAGETFTCNKDLFGFSLMKDTSTVAVVGVGGGALVGAGVGAIAGHGNRAFDCEVQGHREMLMEQLDASGHIGKLNKYLDADKKLSVGGTLSPEQCAGILGLYEWYTQQYITNDGNMTKSQIEVDVKYSTEIEFRNPKTGVVTATVGAQNKEHEESTKKMIVDATPAAVETSTQAMDLSMVFDADLVDLMINGEKTNMGKSIGIGAAAGAGAGGLATAITAFVERNNINCRVGDGLAQVGFGKSYSIGNLKDFYVKWNLKLPDVIAPTATISDCNSWKNTCASYADLEQCVAAQFNYKPAGAATTTLVRSACAVSGSACIENYAVAKSHGACE